MRLLLLAGCFACQHAVAQDTAARKLVLTPKYVVAQFAGGTGFLSVGPGYSNKTGKGEAELLYGYVPKSVGRIPIHALTVKLRWLPLKAVAVDRLHIQPLSTGVLLNYTFGKQYFLFAPKNYPYNYYGYPTALHGGLFIGSVLSTRAKPGAAVRQWSVYYELTSFDVELASYLGNPRGLSPLDILNLGIGLKASF